jgi:hypothetical protein
MSPFRVDRKQFFFEKKIQKTFVPLDLPSAQRTPKFAKVFCFFFSKKKTFVGQYRATPREPARRAAAVALAGSDGGAAGRLSGNVVFTG